MLLPELLHLDRGRDVRVIGVHVLDGIDRVDACESSVERGFDAGGRIIRSVEAPGPDGLPELSVAELPRAPEP